MNTITAKLMRQYHRLSPGFRRRLIAVISFLVLLNIGVWGITLLNSRHNPQLLGLVLLAYGFGLRHAVDADHIAAIDNTTRKLMADGQRPVAVGFFFSLGHSTIVIVLSVFLAVSASLVTTRMPALKSIGTVIGTGVSSVFLLLIGIINLVTLIEIFRLWSGVVKGSVHDEKAIHAQMYTKGFLARLFRPFLRAVSHSWNMYVVGFLFGLGFDTASEVGLLTLSAATGAQGAAIFDMLLLPLSFTAGMSLIDTLDGILMLGAYGWAYLNPIRKLYYNMNITLISVIVALCIGGIEAMQLVSSEFGLRGPVFSAINAMSVSSFGYLIVAAFGISWLVSVSIYRLKGYDRIRIKP